MKLDLKSKQDLMRQVERLEARIEELEESRSPKSDPFHELVEFRSLYDTTPVMMHSTDAQDRLTSVNEYWLKTLGYAREEVIGRRSTDFLTESSRGYLADVRIPRFIKSGEKECRELRIVKKNGDIMDVLSTALAVRDEDGAFLHGRAFLVDITESKRVEQALRESERRYRYMYDHTPIMMHSLDKDHRLISVNEYWLTKTGYTREEVMAHSISEFFTEDSVPYIEQAGHPKFFSTGRLKGLELKCLKKNGDVFDVLVNAVAVRDKTGEFQYSLAFLLDVSEQTRAEKDRRILEDQMRHVQKLESLGVLAGGIAHDFNNLLMGILGNANLAAMETEAGTPLHMHIERIEETAQRAAELTSQMLAYSGKSVVHLESLDLSTLVERMASLLEVSVTKKAALVNDFQLSLPAIKGDASRIRQIVLNLITNASDALSEDGGVITLSTGTLTADRKYLSETFIDDVLEEGEYVYVEVSDTGSGMDKETIAKIFDPFFTTKFAGRGLGLGAVIGIVRAHKGAVHIYSEPGVGTTFRVLFPSLNVPAPKSDKIEVTGPSAMEPPVAHGTVLLVDDEEVALDVTKTALARSGYTVLTACDGREGVDLFRNYSGEIDLVLLDLTMPQLDGRGAYIEFKRLRDNVPIILMSGHTEELVRIQMQGQAFDGFLQKPYRVASLLEKVREITEASIETGSPSQFSTPKPAFP